MNKRMAFLIDTRYCNDCKTCEIACKMERRLPVGQRWRVVRRLEVADQATDTTINNNKNAVFNITMACNHCEKPQCVEVCPVNAYTKLPNGIVMQKHLSCIGCTKCVAACPYTAPVYNPDTGRTGKCDMCIDRQEIGMEPYCVQCCPNNALKIGDYEDLVASFGANQDLKSSAKPSAAANNFLPDGAFTNPSIVLVLPD